MEIGSVTSLSGMTGMMGMQGGMMQGVEKPDASEMSSDFIDAMYSDGDGQLSQTEFSVGDGETQSTEAFDALDTNEGGYVSQDEIEADMESRLGSMPPNGPGGMFSGIEDAGSSDQFQLLLDMVGSGSGQNQAEGAGAYGQMQEGVFDLGGLGAEIRERFFEKYVTAGKENGTGLGTYFAALIARTHGDDITMRTCEEAGTVMCISFRNTGVRCPVQRAGQGPV